MTSAKTVRDLTLHLDSANTDDLRGVQRTFCSLRSCERSSSHAPTALLPRGARNVIANLSKPFFCSTPPTEKKQRNCPLWFRTRIGCLQTFQGTEDMQHDFIPLKSAPKMPTLCKLTLNIQIKVHFKEFSYHTPFSLLQNSAIEIKL